jgi:hypothetical protein
VQWADKRASPSELMVKLARLVQSPRIERCEGVQRRPLLIEGGDAVEVSLYDCLAGQSATVANVDALDGRLDG